MSSNDLAKSVAKKLKYYFEVTRLEDGFDLSDANQPILDHPPAKMRPVHQNKNLETHTLKNYIGNPAIRKRLAHGNLTKEKRHLVGRSEVQMRNLLDKYMHQYTFQGGELYIKQRKRCTNDKRNALPTCYYINCRTKSGENCRLKPSTSGQVRRKDKRLAGGWPQLRTVPEPHISKGEATRLVNSASRLLVATRIPQRPQTASSACLPKRKQKVSTKIKAYDDIYLSRRPRSTSWSASPNRQRSARRSVSPAVQYRRPRSPTPSQSTVASYTTNGSQSTAQTKDERPKSSKYRSRNIINVPKPASEEEVSVIRSTQTVVDYDVGSQTDRQLLDKFDQLEQEVTDGPWCEYQIYVCTGDRIGASTKAEVRMTIYGDKGKTKEFTLSDSKRHKLPFQKGKEDLFILPAHHVGKMMKIQIGHDRPELSYAWFLEGVTVYDMKDRKICQFPCERWLSGQDGDKRTYRILHVDRERNFIDALEEDGEQTRFKTRPKHTYGSESSSSDELQTKVKKDDGLSLQVRPKSASSRSGSESSDSEQSQTKVSVDDQGMSPRDKQETKTKPKDDFDEIAQTGTIITLHTANDDKPVEEIYVDGNALKVIQHPSTQPGQEFVAGYKAALSANEAEEKKRLEREREMDRALLQGKTIHEASREGDIERVKELLHHFPEMRDFKDESGWTALHIAASRGNNELLRWLITSDADMGVDTPTGYSAMHIAALNGHVNSMMLLQAMGASIMSVSTEKQSALHLAAKSGHLECVKWLVANRAPLLDEDNSGRTPMVLAEQFGHMACADFLRICMKELSNPRSTFAMMHRRPSGSGLPPIEEDEGSVSSGNYRKDDVRGHSHSSDSEDENRNKKKTKEEEKELQEKRKAYDEQQKKMEDGHYSFLDSIRQEASEA